MKKGRQLTTFVVFLFIGVGAFAPTSAHASSVWYGTSAVQTFDMVESIPANEPIEVWAQCDNTFSNGAAGVQINYQWTGSATTTLVTENNGTNISQAIGGTFGMIPAKTTATTITIESNSFSRSCALNSLMFEAVQADSSGGGGSGTTSVSVITPTVLQDPTLFLLSMIGLWITVFFAVIGMTMLI